MRMHAVPAAGRRLIAEWEGSAFPLESSEAVLGEEGRRGGQDLVDDRAGRAPR
jgi:hypothetical protein